MHQCTTESGLHKYIVIVVDITVGYCQIRAARPIEQNNPMPNTDAEKLIFWNSVNSADRQSYL
jgi:hypothetical protein